MIDNFAKEFNSEDKCHTYLEHLRWGDDVACPRCRSLDVTRVTNRRTFECAEDGCGYQFSVRVGTIFQNSKLPLWKWVLAVRIMVESPKSISSHKLKRALSVTYKTAWFLRHRIRAAMKDESSKQVIEIDKTWIKHSIPSLYHQSSSKYLSAYLDEAMFRYNNRNNPCIFNATLLKLIGAKVLTHEELTTKLPTIDTPEIETPIRECIKTKLLQPSPKGFFATTALNTFADFFQGEWQNEDYGTDLIKEITQLLPETLPASIASEAQAELILALLEKRIARPLTQETIKPFISHAFRDYANKFQFVSLNAPAGPDNEDGAYTHGHRLGIY